MQSEQCVWGRWSSILVSPLSPPPPSMGEARLARLIFSPENCLSLPPVCPPHPANYPTLAGHSVQLLGPSTRRKQRNVSSHSCPIIAIRGQSTELLKVCPWGVKSTSKNLVLWNFREEEDGAHEELWRPARRLPPAAVPSSSRIGHQSNVNCRAEQSRRCARN